MNKITLLIEELSNASDNPEAFQAAFEGAVARRENKRRAARAEARQRIGKQIRVYLLNGNSIHLRWHKDIWIAEHFELEVFAVGASVVEALEAVFDASITYVASLFEQDRKALAVERQRHAAFIATYSGPKEWQRRFQAALSVKLEQLNQAHRQEQVESGSNLGQPRETPRIEAKPKQAGSTAVQWLESLFERFKNGWLSPEVALQAKKLDVDRLREFYNENLIPLTLAQVHVTVLPDNDGIILHFINGLNGLEVTIYRLPENALESADGRSITRKIRGNDVRFSLSALGLTIYELDQVAFRIAIGDKYVQGRL